LNPAGAPWPKRAYAWYVVVILMVAYGFAILDRVAIGLLVQPIETDLNISDSQIGLLQGFAFGIFYSVLGMPLGFLVDRWQRRPIVTIGIALWSFATIACGLARGFAGLFLARIGVGVGESTISPGAASMIADYFPPEVRPRAYGVFMLGTTFGSGLAFLLGGVAIDAAHAMRLALPGQFGGFSEWQIVFFIIGAPGLLLAALVSLTVREPSRREQLGAIQRFSIAPLWAQLNENRAAYACLIFGAVMNLMCIYAQLSWFATLFIRVHHWTAPEIGRTLGLLGVPVGIVSALSSGWVMTWLARRGHADAPMLTALCHSVSLAVFGTASCLAPSPTVSLICFIGMGFPTTWSYASALTGLNQITPNEMRGQLVAIYTLLVGLVSVGLGSFAVGFLADNVYGGRQAIAPSLASVFAFCGVAGAILLLVGRRPFRGAAARALLWKREGD
jgi:MFS family permease